MEKIKKARGISVVLLFIMVFQMIMPVNFAYGDEFSEPDEGLSSGDSYLLSDSTTSSAITATLNLEFKDSKGNIINHKDTSVTVPFDASVNLKVRLDIEDMDSTNDPNDKNYIDTSHDYVIKIAEQINISENKVVTIYHPVDKDVPIATANINIDGTIIITFLKAINDYDTDRFVKVEADGTMDVSELGGGGAQDLEFEFPGKTEYVNVKFDEKVEKVTVNKTGSWDKGKNEITWTITAKGETTPSGGTITDIVITDTLGLGQTFVSQDAGVAYDSVNNTFTFAELRDGETKTIKIVTKPDLSAFDSSKEGQTVVISNTVSGKFGKDNKDTNTKTTTVTSTIDFINKKNGSFIVGATREDNYIEWTIEINNNNLVMPSGTKLEDVIPQGLKLIDGTVKIDDIFVNSVNFPNVSLTESANAFSIIFQDGLTKKTKITYRTSINDPNAYDPDKTVSYTNNASLIWSGKSVTGTGTAGIGRTVIEKSGNGYEENDNRYVKWKITVNKDKLDIINPVVTDTLPVELEYVSSVAPLGWTTTATAIDGNATVEFRYVGTLNITATIDIIARVKDGYKEIYGANKSTDFKNKVKLSGNNIATREKEASQIYNSTVISKTNTGYDYDTRKATWKVVVNQNKMTINNAIVTDTIGNYHEFVDGSLKLGGNSLTQVTGVPGIGQYSVENKVITINLGKIDKTTETITYETIIPDNVLEDIFGKNSTNNTPKITNSATLTGNEIKDGGQNVTSEKVIKNTVISKNAKYTPGNDFIEWLVEINLNQLDFGSSEVTLEDTLQSILILDKNSVKLYELTMKSDGTYNPIADSNIVKDKLIVDYDTFNNKVEFKLGQVNKAYLLKFTTDINRDELTQTISNAISLKGHSKINDDATGSIPVSFNNVGGEGGGSKTKGSIKIVKIDDYDIPIKGVKFELFNNMKKPFVPAKVSVTNDEGFAFFDDLLMGTYWIKEVEGPEDFILLENETSITLKKGLPTTELDPKNPVVTIVNEKIVKDKIKFKKVDGLGEALKAVKFDLYKKGDNNSFASASSDGLGFVTFDNITKGEYVVKESEAPEGYLKSNRVIYIKAEKISDDSSKLNITYSYNGVDYNVINPELINNTIDIELIKKNDRNMLLPGATFTLYDSNGNYVDEAESKSIIAENSYGNVVFKGIKPGTYTIEETKFPEGYIQTPLRIRVTVSVSEEGTAKIVTFDGYEANEIPTIVNKLDIKDDVIILKVDTSDRPLKLAVFELYTLANGVLTDLVGTSQSLEDGTVRFENISEGDYAIKEITPPVGYVKSDNLIYVKVDRTQDSKPKVEYSIDGNNYSSVIPKIVNNPINIEFIKKDNNNAPLEGAVFALYNDGNPVLGDNDEILTATSNNEGKVLFTAIPSGIYTIEEVKPPSGYKPLESTIEVTVAINADKTESTVKLLFKGSEYPNGQLEVINERIPSKPVPVFGKIAIKKTDEDKKVLSGAEFTLYDENGKVVDRGVTGSDGILSFEDLALGKYVIKETKAPVGYVLSETESDVTINNSQTKTFTFTNKKEEPKKPGRIEIVKTDEDGKLLSDAWFSLVDENGSTLQNIETVNGHAAFENVPVGRYTVKEVQAPKGYEVSNQFISVTVASGETIKVKVVNKLLGTPVVPATGNIVINKVNEKSMALSGAEFTLYNENNQIIGTDVSDERGRVIFENLADGKYFVRETKAPEGYALSSDTLTVNVAGGNTYTYRFKNIPESVLIEDPDVPSGWEAIDDPGIPGDNLPVLPNTGSFLNTWILILIGLVFIIAGIVLYSKRKIIG